MTDTPPATTTVPQLPSISFILLEAPLYAEFPFIDSHGTRLTLQVLRNGSVQMDAHCLKCKKESVFKTVGRLSTSAGTQAGDWMLANGRWVNEIACVRNPNHVYRYYLAVEDRTLRKVGQWPSLEDIAGADIAKYRPLLKGGYFRELKVATGLASHGVGIGSFVYLRRIFEKLIHQHHNELPEPIKDFDTMRMDEKISALKAVLPPALVKNKAAYAILSKGLHELDEETCQLYFPAVRSAIIGILEQDFQARELRASEKALQNDIANIATELSKSAAKRGDV